MELKTQVQWLWNSKSARAIIYSVFYSFRNQILYFENEVLRGTQDQIDYIITSVPKWK